MRKFIFSVMIFICCVGNIAIAATEKIATNTLVSPWGICAHPHSDREYNNIDREISMMQAAGIKWVREDFQFARVCREKGKFDFAIYDDLINRFQSAGIQMLPILQGYGWEIKNSRSELMPLHEHLDAWRLFVKAVVTRYHTRIHHWEIWNEEDGGFWRPDKPNAGQYVKILNAAYEEIKAVDSNAVVIVGGLCGFNSAYLKQMFKSDIKPRFDAIAIHPYGVGVDNAYVKAKYDKFVDILKANGCGNKPIWITEGGCSTFKSALMAENPDFLHELIVFGLKKINYKITGKIKTAVIDTSPYGSLLPDSLIPSLQKSLPDMEVDVISANDIDAQKYPVILWHRGEGIEHELVKPLLDYVNSGGLLVSLGGIPFYYEIKANQDGTRKQVSAAYYLQPGFGINYQAWWTDKHLPRKTELSRINPELSDYFNNINHAYATRFIDDKNLKRGETYIPVLQAVNDDGKIIADIVAMYKFGDKKGGIIVSIPALTGGHDEAYQANLYQRIYLAYMALGIKHIFLYDFHNDGTVASEKENNFGIVDYYWRPKPAYYAYQAMTSSLGVVPSFVKRIKSDDKDIYALIFHNKESNKNILALWSVNGIKKINITGLAGDNSEDFIVGKEVIFITLEEKIEGIRIKKKGI